MSQACTSSFIWRRRWWWDWQWLLVPCLVPGKFLWILGKIHNLWNYVFASSRDESYIKLFWKIHENEDVFRLFYLLNLFIINILHRNILMQNWTKFFFFATIIICACFSLESLIFGYCRYFLSISFHYGHQWIPVLYSCLLFPHHSWFLSQIYQSLNIWCKKMPQ